LKTTIIKLTWWHMLLGQLFLRIEEGCPNTIDRCGSSKPVSQQARGNPSRHISLYPPKETKRAKYFSERMHSIGQIPIQGGFTFGKDK